MKAKAILIGAVLATLLCRDAVQGQAPQADDLPKPNPAAAVPEGPPPRSDASSDLPWSPSGPSAWIMYGRDNCCMGPVGNPIPLASELYLRSGVDLPFGSTHFGRALSTGWAIQGGARVLWFNPYMTRAWTVDASISNYTNDAGGDDVVVPIRVGAATFNSTIRHLNRTFANLAFGREWYLFGTAITPGNKWRVGVDSGAGWGSAKADFQEIRHRTDVIGRAFVAAHSDFEMPWGCCIFLAGFRAEWSYTWSDILQQTSDLQDINLLINLGVRF